MQVQRRLLYDVDCSHHYVSRFEQYNTGRYHRIGKVASPTVDCEAGKGWMCVVTYWYRKYLHVHTRVQ